MNARRASLILAALAPAAVLLQALPSSAQDKGILEVMGEGWDKSWEFTGDITTPHPTRTTGTKVYDFMTGGRDTSNLEPVPRGMNQAMSKPGYRAEVTPESLAFYRHCMEKQGRGEDLNWAEAWTAQFMQATRQWPEKPTTSAADRHAQQWSDNAEGLRNEPMARLTWMAQSSGGNFEQDIEPPPNMEKFRKLYYNTPPEQRTTTMNALMKLFKAQSYDMRSDKRRKEDAEYAAAQKEKWEAALEKERAEKQAKIDKENADAQEQKDWFEEARTRDAAVEAMQRLKAAIGASKQDGYEPGMISGEGPPSADDAEAARQRLLAKIRESKQDGAEFAPKPPPQQGAKEKPPAVEEDAGEAVAGLLGAIFGIIETVEEVDDMLDDDDDDDEDDEPVVTTTADDDDDDDDDKKSSRSKKRRHSKKKKKKKSSGKCKKSKCKSKCK